MASNSARQESTNNVAGTPKSSTEVSPQQQSGSVPSTAYNNIMRADIAQLSPMYMQQQMPPPHMQQHLMVAPQANYSSQQTSPIANGTYSNPGSVGPQCTNPKSKGSKSRETLYGPSTAGQNGPPVQMHMHMQGSPMPGNPATPSSSQMSSQQMQQQIAQQQQQMMGMQQQQLQSQQQSGGYPPGMYGPSYWQAQQRYMQPCNFYQAQMQQPVFPGYGVSSGSRPIMPNTPKMHPQQQTVQMDLPRLPNGPISVDWQARMGTGKSSAEGVQQTQQQQQVASTGMPTPSPGGASSAADESIDDSKSLPGTSPSPWPQTPSQLSQGQRTPVPCARSTTPAVISAKPKDASIIERLIGPVTAQNPQQVMPERRAFFEKLVQFCEQQGEPITQVPQVSKQIVDLHRLYLAVLNRGGFEQVTRDRTWKQVCSATNSEMSESSAAGYQLRKHYQKYLLGLECLETGKNPSEVIAFAERLKKRKKDKDPPVQQFSAPGQSGPAGYGQLDPNSYYYGHMDPNLQGRPQGPVGWPSQAYPPGPSGAGAPPPVYHAGMRPNTQMRPPLPQQLMQGSVADEQQRFEEQQRHFFQQQQAAFVAQQQQQQLPRATTPSTNFQTEGSGTHSRAPSAGPVLESQAASDNSSRQSAVDESNHGRSSVHSQGPTATPPTSVPTCPQQSQQQVPPTMPFYGQHPQMYGSPGLRPTAPPPMQMKPGSGYMPIYPQAQQSGGYPAAHYSESYQAVHPGMSQQAYQQQMWASQQGQRYPSGHINVPTSSAMTGPQMCGSMMPRPASMPVELSALQQHQQQQQQAYVTRRPPYCMPSSGSSARAPSPGSNRMRYGAPNSSNTRQAIQSQYATQTLLQQGGRQMFGQSAAYPHMSPSTSSGITNMHPSTVPGQQTAVGSGVNIPGGSIMHQAYHASVQPHPMQFPSDSVEATSISQRRRRKLLAKDLIGTSTKRITMALRSGLDTEITWALNALNVQLYDDTASPTMLNHSPGLLNVLVEHLRATLSILFADIFKVGIESKAITVDDDQNRDFWLVLPKSERTIMQSLITQRSSKNEPNNFTNVSRTGRKVHTEKKEIPEWLKRRRPDDWMRNPGDESFLAEYYTSRLLQGLGGETSSYLAACLKTNLKLANFIKSNECSKSMDLECVEPVDDRKLVKANVECGNRGIMKEGIDSVVERQHKSHVEMAVIRPTALCIRNEPLMQVVNRCLAVSNILRGLSFLPGNEGVMAKHAGLLFIIGRLLRLYSEKTSHPLTKQMAENDDLSCASGMETFVGANRRLKESGDLLEPDDDESLLLFETATQLKEDAFVVMTHISVQLDLYDFDSDVSWPIFDTLIQWCVCQAAEAKDPLNLGPISPRCYALEILCKMSVIERNVDLLLSTGPWFRMENFIKVLVGLLSLSEETSSREFAIVILHAICFASDQACYVVAAESSAIHSLVSFLEMGDANMHQIAQQHGIQALRENPEMMGTSVPMLRRAAAILNHLCRVPACCKFFKRYQHRLLQFTMSHLMDSRVGQTITDVLFAMQSSTLEELKSQATMTDHDCDDFNMEGPSKQKILEIKKRCRSVDSNSREDTNSANKSTTDRNGVSKELVVAEEQSKKCSSKECSAAPSPKRQRLENGMVKHLTESNGGTSSTSTLKSLVNGDVKTVNALQSVSRSTPATPAGSVQAVA